VFGLLYLAILIGICLTTYLFLKKRGYSDAAIALILQTTLIIGLAIDIKYNLYILIQVETYKFEILEKLVDEVKLIKILVCRGIEANIRQNS